MKKLLQSLFSNTLPYRSNILFGCFLFAVYVAAVVILPHTQTVIPAQGGAFSEGMVGQPRFVNPVLAMSSTDKSLVALIFAGLFSTDSEGVVVVDLALDYVQNEEATEYTITIDPRKRFHSGSQVSSHDVAFTLEQITDPLIKSPLALNFAGVEWETPDARTIVFSLERADQHFISKLQFGVLSSEHWSGIGLEEFPFALHNISPIGAGPYRIIAINRDNQEHITSYLLSAFESGTYINDIDIVFFENQIDALQAFESGLVDNLANISPQELLALDHTLKAKNIQSYPLERAFLLFFNEYQHEILSSPVVRGAISQHIDTEDIVREILFNRAQVSDSPLSLEHPYYTPATTSSTFDYDAYKKALGKMGWKAEKDDGLFYKDELPLTLSLDIPQAEELSRVAQAIAEDLHEIGITLEIHAHTEQDIVEQVIRKRTYQMLIFGQLANDIDSLYAFWHSSGQSDPGINIANYSSKTVDAILERLVDGASKAEEFDYHNLQKEIRNDTAAVFLYHPHFIYATDQSVQNVVFGKANFAWDRFSGIENWYIKTDSLLNWFLP